jgi:hypothetical protein
MIGYWKKSLAVRLLAILALCLVLSRASMGADVTSAPSKVAALNKILYGVHKFRVPNSAAPIISGKDGLNLYMLHRFIRSSSPSPRAITRP